MKKNILFILRFFISFSLIFYLLRKLNFQDILSRTSNLNYFFLFLAFICQFFAMIGGTYRWKILLSSKGIKVSFRKLFTFGIIGQFFSSFLPGSIGGDVFRIYKIIDHSDDKMSAGSSIFAERIIGMYSLLTVVLISAILGFTLIPQKLLSSILFTVAIFYFVLIIFIFLKSFIIKYLGKTTQGARLNQLKQYISRIYEALFFFITHREALFKTIIISVVMEFFSIISCYFAAKAIGLSLFILYFFIFLPIIFFFTSIPISLSGIGIREGVFVYLFKIVNVTSDQAVFMSLLYFSATLFIILIV